MLVALAGTALLLAVAGVATGLGYGLRAGDTGGTVARMLGAGLAQLPAALVIVGDSGRRRSAWCRGSRWRWGGPPSAWRSCINIFGQVLQLSHWVLDVSPFTHVPRLPGGTVSAPPVLWLSLVALAPGGRRHGHLRRRDIG